MCLRLTLSFTSILLHLANSRIVASPSTELANRIFRWTLVVGLLVTAPETDIRSGLSFLWLGFVLLGLCSLFCSLLRRGAGSMGQCNVRSGLGLLMGLGDTLFGDLPNLDRMNQFFQRWLLEFP